VKATRIIHFLTVVSVSVCICNASASEIDTPLPIPTIDAAASVGYFYVGGRYVGESGAQVMQGAMYVEVLRPKRVIHRYPLVLIHGTGQTGTNWLGTPDGRQGWAQYFLTRGYVAYIVDQPARGRSAWHRGIDGELKAVPAPVIEKLFTAPEEPFGPPFRDGVLGVGKARPWGLADIGLTYDPPVEDRTRSASSNKSGRMRRTYMPAGCKRIRHGDFPT
jgi:pimeloyl-ACP methyl ester carboxylesterase